MAGEPARPLEERLERGRRSAEQRATMHACLGDRYEAWHLHLTLASILSSAGLLAFVYASDFVYRTTPVSADLYQWASGIVAIFFFCVTLVGLVWQPTARAARHGEAVRHYTKAKYEIRRLLDAGSGALDEESVRRVEDLYLDDREVPRVSERRYLELKRWHELKRAVEKELDRKNLSPVKTIEQGLVAGSGPSSFDDE